MRTHLPTGLLLGEAPRLSTMHPGVSYHTDEAVCSISTVNFYRLGYPKTIWRDSNPDFHWMLINLVVLVLVDSLIWFFLVSYSPRASSDRCPNQITVNLPDSNGPFCCSAITDPNPNKSEETDGYVCLNCSLILPWWKRQQLMLGNKTGHTLRLWKCVNQLTFYYNVIL